MFLKVCTCLGIGICFQEYYNVEGQTTVCSDKVKVLNVIKIEDKINNFKMLLQNNLNLSLYQYKSTYDF